MKARIRIGLAVAALLVAVPLGLSAGVAAAGGAIVGAGHVDAIAGSYLVVYKTDARAGVDLAAADPAIEVAHTYRTALRGFSATMDERQARRLAAHPDVAFVEQNRTVQLTVARPTHTVHDVRPAGTPLPVPPMGRGVTAYVIDTGIRTTHTMFGTRARWGTNTTGDGIGSDCHGHGTHVAGIVGGSNLPGRWSAWNVSLVAVKVLGCTGSGTLAGITAGVDWVTAHRTGPSIANMSLGAARSSTVDQAVRNSIASGVTYVVAAGNSGADACYSSPAAVTQAITVGAAHDSKLRAWFSNYGVCLDVFAPGVGITSAWHTSTTAMAVLSGTSMAAPSVAAHAAVYLSANLGATPAQVTAAVLSAAEANVVVDPGPGSPNRYRASATSPPPAPPTAASLGCESFDARINCSATATGTVTDIWWFVNNSPASSGRYWLSFGCASNTTVTIMVRFGNPGGVGQRSTSVRCSTGPPV